MLGSDRPVPKLSVIIPTIGRNKEVADTVFDLSRQNRTDFEIVIVTQSDDRLVSVQETLCETGVSGRCFRLQEPNASLARNIGILESKGEVLLFLDDDLAIPNQGFLSAHLSHYCDPKSSGIMGQILDPTEVTRRRLHRFAASRRNGWLFFPGNYAFSATVRSGISCNLSVRREWAIEVGGMDAQFEKGGHREEADFCLRYTDRFGPLNFDPNSSVIHLQVRGGGCRSGTEQSKKPARIAPHHLQCEWYFLRRGLKLGTIRVLDLPLHMVALFRRQIATRKLLDIPQRTFASIAAWRAASRRVSQTPRYLSSVSSDVYELLWQTEPQKQRGLGG